MLTSSPGNFVRISLLRVTSNRWKKIPTKANTFTLEILRPGQRLTPPPKGRYDECLRRPLFSANRFASKLLGFAPHTFSLKWSCRLGMRTSAPGRKCLLPMQVGASTFRPIMAPPLSRRHSWKTPSSIGAFAHRDLMSNCSDLQAALTSCFTVLCSCSSEIMCARTQNAMLLTFEFALR